MIDTVDERATDISIRAAVCPVCGRILYPIPLVCSCGQVHDLDGPPWEEREIAGPCTLLTWTRLKALPDGFTENEMILGMVEFSNGVRAIGLLDSESPKLGMELEAEVQPCNAGEYRHGPRYVLKETSCVSS